MEKDVNIDQIHLDRSVLRENVTADSVKQLADSIAREGLLQALVVRERQDGGFSLIAGRRRLEACRSLGFQTVPCRIFTSAHIDEIPAFNENLIRLQMTPLEEARAVRMLYEEKGLSMREIADQTSHSLTWVQDRLSILNLPELLQEAIGNKHLSIAGAFMLSQIEDSQLRDYYVHLAKVNGASAHQCEAWLLAWRSQQMLTQPAQAPTGDSQPPGMPPPYPYTCFSCSEPKKAEDVLHVPLCRDCNQYLAQRAAELTAALPGPGHPEEEPTQTPEPEPGAQNDAQHNAQNAGLPSSGG